MADLHLLLTRTKLGDDSTLGAIIIDREFECFTLEDEIRAVKIKGETAIPPGTYKVLPRAEGGMHPKYAARYPFHVGMAHLQDVPGFEYVYIHTGNTDDHTDGCILVGTNYKATGKGGNHVIEDSRTAYKKLYRKMAAAWAAGGKVTIKVLAP